MIKNYKIFIKLKKGEGAMFHSEKPINCIEEDLLEHSNEDRDFSKHILNYKNNDSLTIGIIGKWVDWKNFIYKYGFRINF